MTVKNCTIENKNQKIIFTFHVTIGFTVHVHNPYTLTGYVLYNTLHTKQQRVMCKIHSIKLYTQYNKAWTSSAHPMHNTDQEIDLGPAISFS